MRRAFVKAMGCSDDALTRPIVGITDTGGDYDACHGGMAKLVEAVKRGVMPAGGKRRPHSASASSSQSRILRSPRSRTA